MLGVSLGGYLVLSVAVASGFVAQAALTRGQFYPTVVYLCASKAALLSITNLCLTLCLAVGLGLKKLFLGTLRDTEIEHLNERVWPTLTDTLLMMTIFRDDFGVRFFSLFGLVMALKIFLWLAYDRVSYVSAYELVHFFNGCVSILTFLAHIMIRQFEVNPNFTRLNHARVRRHHSYCSSHLLAHCSPGDHMRSELYRLRT